MSTGTFADLDHRPAVSLADLNSAAALQTRTDRKYVVEAHRAVDAIEAFGAEVQVLEMAGRRTFAYDSVYFDTPALDSYLLAAHGRRRRYKIRTRTYVDSGISFLEVKTEGARAATVKERIPYEPSDSHRLTPAGLDYINETLACSIGSVPSGNLRPVIETAYRRITLYLPSSASRATLDLGVTWRRPGGQAHELDGAVIIETKSGSAASALDRHLWAYGIRPCRISKFATGMAALDPSLPANRWHRTVSTTLPLRPLSR
ncbi:polyphosphate polymerase domain-containing protein [Arthrobacter agilis]|uniref:polyphosphate polymerase domain-containing protein n=1 Tax=Arthrobacter agilis TaxID=37921 RepID=UPI000B35AFCE|nr:polyphosphate polymerase domain-containing protein [Arthrobacter agilis]OUM42229.1 molecular chaperone [Arthrobacter agilis]PPB45572.1 VTC domain-containing protein [Arthrobacter agilis]TPV26447.1 polyphosphate polymerase domain-containing protein [Arthrobacter agilis]VDR33653.1 VTC domain [Arthrobacter agilis]